MLSVGICLQEDVFWGDLSVIQHFNLLADIIGLDNPVSLIKDWIDILGLANFSGFKA